MVLEGALKSHAFPQTAASKAFERFHALITIMMLKKYTFSLGKATTTKGTLSAQWVFPMQG